MGVILHLASGSMKITLPYNSFHFIRAQLLQAYILYLRSQHQDIADLLECVTPFGQGEYRVDYTNWLKILNRDTPGWTGLCKFIEESPNGLSGKFTVSDVEEIRITFEVLRSYLNTLPCSEFYNNVHYGLTGIQRKLYENYREAIWLLLQRSRREKEGILLN